MDEIIDEYWSDDRSRYAAIIKSTKHAAAFKLLFKELNKDREFFKYHIFLCEAQDEAEDFCLDE